MTEMTITLRYDGLENALDDIETFILDGFLWVLFAVDNLGDDNKPYTVTVPQGAYDEWLTRG